MSLAQDRGHCLRNLVRLMCCDGKITETERRFLAKVARELNAKVRDWPAFVKETLADPRDLWPVADRRRAIATLKSLVAMARADGRVGQREKGHIARFAKTLGVTADEWRQILDEADSPDAWRPFKSCSVGLYAIEDDFERLGDLVELATDHDIPAQTTTLEAFLSQPPRALGAVCFHAVENTEATVARGRRLLEVTGDKSVAVLTRFQGRQVQYLLETGLTRCVIEPLYPRDLPRILGED